MKVSSWASAGKIVTLRADRLSKYILKEQALIGLAAEVGELVLLNSEAFRVYNPALVSAYEAAERAINEG